MVYKSIRILAMGLMVGGGGLLLTSCSQKFDPSYNKAIKAFEEGNFIKSIDASHAAITRWDESDGDEKKAQAYQLLGKSYHKLRKIDKAVDAYSRATKLSDDTYDSAYAIGLIYLTSDEPKLAAKSFQDALRMKNDDPWALVGLGNAHYAQKAYRKARQIYKRVIDSSPGVKESMEYIGLIDRKLGVKRPTKKTRKSSKKRGR